jgi:molecular chaperone Hsp33
VSELHKFLFDKIRVRGAIVRIDDAWVEILRRRASNTSTGAYPAPVQALLGEMVAAGVLMQSGIKFDGALILQIQGDGPVKLAVAEVQADLSLRATASVTQALPGQIKFSEMVNVNNLGKCAITLDPKTRFPGQQAYQGIVALFGDRKEKLEKVSDVLSHYMLQSEQLQTTLVLAANDTVAAGLLIQSLPEAKDQSDDYDRIAILAASLKQDELLQLDAETLLRRLFWEESLIRFAPEAGEARPRFACSCSRDRVSRMIFSLGAQEADSILAERGNIEVGCDFCGQQYQFDAVDAAQVFVSPALVVAGGSSPQ